MTYFNVLRLHRNDIAEKWDGADKLTDHQMAYLARKMGDNETIMEVFWLYIDTLDEFSDFKTWGLTRKAVNND